MNIIPQIAKTARAAYMPYPETIRRETGIKVGWLYYDNEADALEASKAARHNAWIYWDQGYDFGYCSPGSVTKTDNGEWKVCRP